jgi:hypothetical protein
VLLATRSVRDHLRSTGELRIQSKLVTGAGSSAVQHIASAIVRYPDTLATACVAKYSGRYLWRCITKAIDLSVAVGQGGNRQRGQAAGR